MLILIRLLQFVFCTTATRAKDRRLKTAISVWIVSCILLGIAWILGPVLGFIVDENGQTNSVVGQGIQWTFTLLIGLEGVGILIVNILFYLRVRQKRSYLSGRMRIPKKRRKWWSGSDLSRIYMDTRDDENKNNN
jgi:formate-dependent nitrite reductase membrane component NrfD